MVHPGYPVQSPAPAGPRASNPLQLAGIVLVVAAALLAVGVFTRSWISVSIGSERTEGDGKGIDFSFVMGPMGGHSCFEAKCEDMSWSKMDPDPDSEHDTDSDSDSDSEAKEDKSMPNDLAVEAKLVLILGLLGAALAAVAGIIALTGQLKKPVVKLATIGLGVAAALVVIFELRLLSANLFGQLGDLKLSRMPSWSFFLALAGVVGAGVMLLGPARRLAGVGPAMGMGMGMGAAGPFPGGPFPPPYQAPPPPSYPCMRCQTPLVFVAQYQRWFCQRCQQYA